MAVQESFDLGTDALLDTLRGAVAAKGMIRERFSLKAGTELEILDQPDGMLLRTVEKEPVALVKLDGLWVHRDVAIQEVREERIEAGAKG